METLEILYYRLNLGIIGLFPCLLITIRSNNRQLQQGFFLSSSSCFSSLPSSGATLLLTCFFSGCGSTSLSEEVSLGWAKAVHSCFPGVLSPTLPSTPEDAQSSSTGVLSAWVPCRQSSVSTVVECCKSPPDFQMKGFL